MVPEENGYQVYPLFDMRERRIAPRGTCVACLVLACLLAWAVLIGAGWLLMRFL